MDTVEYLCWRNLTENLRQSMDLINEFDDWLVSVVFDFYPDIYN